MFYKVSILNRNYEDYQYINSETNENIIDISNTFLNPSSYKPNDLSSLDFF